MKTLPKLENLGSLITYKDEGDVDRCLGYIFASKDHGAFDPNFGRIPDLSESHIAAHNTALSQAEIDGLRRCQVGQRGTFYLINGVVQTWMGAVVSHNVSVVGRTIRFKLDGMLFRGVLQKDADCFNFRRVS